MACAFSSHVQTSLVLGVLLLLVLSSQQVPAMHARGRAFPRQELQRTSAPKTVVPKWLLIPRRDTRSTPLWRTMGNKPLGAFCKRNLECITHTCVNRHCTTPLVKS